VTFLGILREAAVSSRERPADQVSQGNRLDRQTTQY
jgi:hypothetical protein